VFSSDSEHDEKAASVRTEDLDAPEIGSAAQEMALILHTSGTTHVPKLIRITRANLLASLDLQQQYWRGGWQAGEASLGTLPLSHLFGLYAELLQCYRSRGRYIFCAANPHQVIEALQRYEGEITRLFTVPWMLQQLFDMPGGTQALQQIRYVLAGGAALADDLGEQLAASGIRVIQGYGMTELGTGFMGEVGGGDWRDMSPLIPAQFWHLEDGTGQLVIHADCPTLSTAPPRQAFPTADLFHRSAGGYRYVGRVDDILVHTTGEKSNALVIEHMLLTRLSTLIEHAAVVGAGRLRLACILLWRHSPSAADHQALLLGIAEINAELASHSQLHSDLLLLLSPAQAHRLPLTGKKTVARAKAASEFQAELAQLYAGAMQAQAGETIESFFERPQDLDPLVSLFDQGLDSLGAARLGMHIAELYPDRALAFNLVYQYPTLHGLKNYLQGSAIASREPPVFPPHRTSQTAHARQDYPPPRRVLLTGATGFIGRYLVEELLLCKQVEHVHCLIRRNPGGLSSDARVTYHTGYDFGDPRLGLHSEVHGALLDEVDTVIHAAWPVDFNASYEQLAESTLASVRHLIEFARRGDKSLHFLSSVSTIMMHPTKPHVDEEWPLPTAAACLPLGYAQTKWEAEHLLIRSGVRHKIYRLAEISAHSVTGRWNTHDHVPILLEVSRALGCAPVFPQPIDWVPVDVACRALVELMTVPDVDVHHIANPHTRRPESLSCAMPCAPMSQWLELAHPHLSTHPRFAALWAFLHELVAWSGRLTTLSADATCAYSPALAECAPIGDDYLKRLLLQQSH